MAKIVSLNRTSTTQGYSMSEQVMNDLRWEMHKYEVSELADGCDVSRSAIYAIRSGRTKWPRGSTLFALLNFMGFEIRIVQRRTGRALGAQ